MLSLERVRIPRAFPPHAISISLVGFCDASETGYAAVDYLLFSLSDGVNEVHMLKAKSRVAHLKTLTIPRLEPSAALLLAKVIDSLRSPLQSITLTKTCLFF